MKIIFASLAAVIFVLVSNPYTSAGEWHSVGNAPPIPYFPKNPKSFHCKLEVFTSWGPKMYLDHFENTFAAENFTQPNMGGSFVIQNAADPGMNGQRIYLNYSPRSSADKEYMRLFVNVSLQDRGGNEVSSFHEEVAELGAGKIISKAVLRIDPKSDSKEIRKSVSVTATCEALK